jgi:phospholipid/cholesterol/gamma-HCH transport system substrate-binding protein
MNERVMKFRVGVMVLATVIITAILILLFDGFPIIPGEGPYKIYIVFPMAPNIAPGTPVRVSGILIGRVAKVEFAEDEGLQVDSGVIVTVEIDANRKLRRNQVPVIGKTLLGDSFIEFIPSSAPRPAPETLPIKHTALKPPEPRPDQKPLQPGEMIIGKVQPDPLQSLGNLEGGLSAAVQSVAKTSDEIGLLTRRVNDILRNNDEQIIRIVGKTEATLDQLQTAVANVNGLIGGPEIRENIQKAAADLPRVLNDVSGALGSMRQTFEAADRNLQNVEGLTKPLGEKGAKLIETVDRAANQLDTVLAELTTFSKSLNSPEGTIGQLLNDPTLYQQINEAATNINQLSYELKPIIKDARAFTDKVSRHPELLGVRGALRPSSGIK